MTAAIASGPAPTRNGTHTGMMMKLLLPALAIAGLLMDPAVLSAVQQSNDTGPAAQLERFTPFVGGTWRAEGEVPGAGRYTAERRYTWQLDHTFLHVQQTMRFDNGPIIEEQMMIGWDPVDQRVHVWSFASDGSYSDGYEVPGQDPQRWTAEGRTMGGRGGEWRITKFLFDPNEFSMLVEVRSGRDYVSAMTMAFHRER